MNYYFNKIEEIRNIRKDIAITTDVIVGFPGETEEDFNDTLSLVKEVEYDSAFTFIYSRRNNTPADKMENQIPEEIKHDRFNRLLEVTNEIIAKKNSTFEGETVEVLVEGPSKNDPDKLMGRTRDGRLVNFTGKTENIGELVNVKITKAHAFSLIGEEI